MTVLITLSKIDRLDEIKNKLVQAGLNFDELPAIIITM